MKKSILLLCFMLCTVAVFAQKKKGKGQAVIDCYTQKIAEKYKLTEEQQTSVGDSYKTLFSERRSISNEMKEGVFTEKEAKAKKMELYENYISELSNLTGSNVKKIRIFEKEALRECKASK